MSNKPETIELNPEELKTLLERVKAAVSEEDYEIIKEMTEVLQAEPGCGSKGSIHQTVA